MILIHVFVIVPYRCVATEMREHRYVSLLLDAYLKFSTVLTLYVLSYSHILYNVYSYSRIIVQIICTCSIFSTIPVVLFLGRTLKRTA